MNFDRLGRFLSRWVYIKWKYALRWIDSRRFRIEDTRTINERAPENLLRGTNESEDRRGDTKTNRFLGMLYLYVARTISVQSYRARFWNARDLRNYSNRFLVLFSIRKRSARIHPRKIQTPCTRLDKLDSRNRVEIKNDCETKMRKDRCTNLTFT